MIEVEFWINTRDGYDNRYITVDTTDEEKSIELAKESNPRGKNFKVYKG